MSSRRHTRRIPAPRKTRNGRGATEVEKTEKREMSDLALLREEKNDQFAKPGFWFLGFCCLTFSLQPSCDPAKWTRKTSQSADEYSTNCRCRLLVDVDCTYDIVFSVSRIIHLSYKHSFVFRGHVQQRRRRFTNPPRHFLSVCSSSSVFLSSILSFLTTLAVVAPTRTNSLRRCRTNRK